MSSSAKLLSQLEQKATAAESLIATLRNEVCYLLLPFYLNDSINLLSDINIIYFCHS